MLISQKSSAHFKGFTLPAEIIMSLVYMKCKFALSYRDIEELSQMRGIKKDHSTIQRWVKRFVPLLQNQLKFRKKPVNSNWRMDETYIKINGKWKYFYRAVDKFGNTIDFMLRAKRDKSAAKAFFRKALKSHSKPTKINIDKSGANTAALFDLNKEYAASGDPEIEIRQNKYLNNRIEGVMWQQFSGQYVKYFSVSFQRGLALNNY